MPDHGARLRHHIDRFCGETPDKLVREENSGIFVVRFGDTPEIGLTTFLSVGLSGHVFVQASGSPIRQEVLMTVSDEFAGLACDTVLFTVGALMLEGHAALRRGQVIEPGVSIFPERPDLGMAALLCCAPAFFPEEFCVLDGDEPTVFVELLPITRGELAMVKREGWSAFCDLVDDGGVDILNLGRGLSG